MTGNLLNDANRSTCLRLQQQQQQQQQQQRQQQQRQQRQLPQLYRQRLQQRHLARLRDHCCAAAAPPHLQRPLKQQGSNTAGPGPSSESQAVHEASYYEWRFGSRIAYISAGTYGPPLLLVHGFGVGSHHFTRNLPGLAQQHRVWALDLLGQGGSWPTAADAQALVGHPDGVLRYSTDTWVEQLQHFIEQRIGEPTYVVGNSLGGYLAVQLAARHPGSVLGVVLLNSTPFWGFSPPLTARASHWLWRHWPTLDGGVSTMPRTLTSAVRRLWFDNLRSPDTVRAMLALVYADEDAIGEELPQRIVDAAASPQALDAFASIMLSPRAEVDFEGALDALQCPLCMAYGRDDPWVVPMWGMRLKRRAPHATYLELTPAGHCPHHEAPTATNRAIMEWVAAAEAARRQHTQQQQQQQPDNGSHSQRPRQPEQQQDPQAGVLHLNEQGSMQQDQEGRSDGLHLRERVEPPLALGDAWQVEEEGGRVVEVRHVDGSPRNVFERMDHWWWRARQAVRAASLWPRRA